jgi:hypothetical protein
MVAGGVDVALAVYRGDRAHRRSYALKGLDVMAEALKELRSEGLGPLTRTREYPQIGMALDLGGLADQYGGPVDLKDADVQRSLYGMVRDFYLHVPEEFRATIQIPPARLAAEAVTLGTASTPQGCAYVVRLLNDSAVSDASDAALSYVNRRFAQEFGARLLWIGTPALKSRIPALDAVAPFPAATQDATIRADGWVRTGSFGPGFDGSAEGQSANNVTIRSRENGQQTVTDFHRIIDGNPDWVFIDSWNGYQNGTDIAPTLEYGLLYRDLVRGAVLQYKQSADYAAHFIKASAPRVMVPGQIYQVDVVVQNSGTSDWDSVNLVGLSYQWIQDGKPVGERGAEITSKGQVRGDARSFLIGVAAPISQSKPLPPGPYELEFNMTRRVGDELVWFDQEETAPYRIPVIVGEAPAGRPYWLGSNMPSLTRENAEYPAQVRLRNDGSDTWRKGSLSVGYRWRRVSTYLKGASADEDVVLGEGKRVPLTTDVPPGRVVTVDVPVATRDAQGRPLAIWSPQEDWTYVLEWDLFDGSRPVGQSGGATYREPVEVLDRDPAPHFLGCNLPSDLIAGRTEKITVGLRNDGPEAWRKGRDKVIVHWYYMDGTEASWHDDELPLQEDVTPFSRVEVQVPADAAFKPSPEGSSDKEKDSEKRGRKKGAKKMETEVVARPTILREVPVRVPYYFGPMYCVLDFQHDGLHASTAAATKGNDILVVPVNVYSPTFTPLPISAYFNLDGMSQDVDRGDGDLDGRGNTLPQEYFPPYVSRPAVGAAPAAIPIYPSGLWSRPLNELDSSRVCFFYPAKVNSTPNMIRCEGQMIQFGGLGRTAVHILGLSTEEDAAGEFTLHYADGTADKRKVTFTHWNDPPKHGERVGFSTPHRHTRAGDDPATRCYVNHYTLPADALKQLVAVELPQQPALKVVAITLEQGTLRK